MKDKYKELFDGKLEVERIGRDVVAIGDKNYHLCEVDGGLTYEDEKEMQRAVYIARVAISLGLNQIELARTTMSDEAFVLWLDANQSK